jgi:hypothetical protein
MNLTRIYQLHQRIYRLEEDPKNAQRLAIAYSYLAKERGDLTERELRRATVEQLQALYMVTRLLPHCARYRKMVHNIIWDKIAAMASEQLKAARKEQRAKESRER